MATLCAEQTVPTYKAMAPQEEDFDTTQGLVSGHTVPLESSSIWGGGGGSVS